LNPEGASRRAIALPIRMRPPSGCLTLNIGTSTGIRARKNGANTCASKAAVMIMTQCFALELAPKVRVNTIIPGLTEIEETRGRGRICGEVLA
jgi:3-oxoacyl-[acyl-carrier protein] reductase